MSSERAELVEINTALGAAAGDSAHSEDQERRRERAVQRAVERAVERRELGLIPSAHDKTLLKLHDSSVTELQSVLQPA